MSLFAPEGAGSSLSLFINAARSSTHKLSCSKSARRCWSLNSCHRGSRRDHDGAHHGPCQRGGSQGKDRARNGAAWNDVRNRHCARPFAWRPADRRARMAGDLPHPAITRSRVDFPQPEGPTKTTNSPAGISRSMPWITGTDPNDLRTLSRRRTPICPSRISTLSGGFCLALPKHVVVRCCLSRNQSWPQRPEREEL